jgi:ribosome biogenesis protein MAK21
MILTYSRMSTIIRRVDRLLKMYVICFLSVYPIGNYDLYFQPALSKDISKFLKELNFKESEPQAAGKQKAEKSQKPAKKQKKSDLQKEKTETVAEPTQRAEKLQKSKKQKKGHAQQYEEPASKPEPVVEVLKVQLPTKVSFNPKSNFICQPIALWHTTVPRLPPSSTTPPPISPSQLSTLTSKATDLHYADTRTFQTSSSSNASSSEANFLSKIIQSGTLSDRLSALTLLVQSSPIHNTKALETLKGMAERGKGKGGRDESLKALRCVVDWWVGGGAPDRKLK